MVLFSLTRSSTDNVCVDNIFGAPVANGVTAQSPAPVPNANGTQVVTDHVKKFFLKNSGVIYENEHVQVGIKMEFRERLGRIQIFYGNKSANSDITNFQAEVSRHVLINCDRN